MNFHEACKNNLVRLGKSDTFINKIGIGAWAWGNEEIWGYNRDFTFKDIEEAYLKIIDMGPTLIDTANSYNKGQSEKIIGYLNEKYSFNYNPPLISTKIMPLPWYMSNLSFKRKVRQSLSRINKSSIDLYQIHRPLPPFSLERWIIKFVRLKMGNYIKNVGVSNCSAEQMYRIQKFLKDYGIDLVSNQVPYNLVYRKAETNEILNASKELNVTLLAFSPLARGLLTDKFTGNNLPSSNKRYITKEHIKQLEPLFKTLRTIGKEYNKKPSQVALNWISSKGIIPIPGAKNVMQVEENINSVGWELKEKDYEKLNHLTKLWR